LIPPNPPAIDINEVGYFGFLNRLAAAHARRGDFEAAHERYDLAPG
jgi:hypothetical protein